MASARRGDDDGTLVEVVPWDDAEPVAGPRHDAGPRRRRRPVLVALAVLLVVVAGVAQVVEDQRAAARADAFAAVPGTVPPIDGPVEAAWQVEPWFSAYQDIGDVIVLSRAGGAVRGVDGATGRERWVLAEPVLGCWESTGAAADERTLLCRGRSAGTGSPDVMARLLLVSGETGQVLGEQTVGTPSYAPAAVGHDVVLVRAGPERLVVERRGMVDGRTRWEVSLPGDARARSGQVTALGDLVVLEGPVSAVLDADDGAVLGAWRSDRGVSSLGWVPVAVRVLGDGYAVRGRGRDAPWHWHDLDGRHLTTVPGRPVEALVSDGSDEGVLLTVTSDLDTLVARGPRDGAELWRTPYRTGHLAVVRDGAVVLVRNGEVVAVDLRNGRVRWRTPVQDASPRSGTVTDGRVVVVVADVGLGTRLVALDLDDGAVLWSERAPSVPTRTETTVTHEFPWVWLGRLGGRAVVLSEGGLTAVG